MAKMAPNHLKKGGTPLFCTVFILYLYNFFPGAGPSPKMVFFNHNMTTGLKKHHFGACGGSPKKIIEVQDGRRGEPRIAPGGPYPMVLYIGPYPPKTQLKGALHAACLKSTADGPRASRYTDFSGARRRLPKYWTP